jgi:hypothetical protein
VTKQDYVQTPDGPIAVNTSTGEASPQKFRRLSVQECARLGYLAAKANSFLRDYIGEVNNPGLKDYDRAFQVWQRSPLKKYTRQEVIEILGSYLGEKLIQDLDMEWVEVSDEVGTDYAVRHVQFEVVAYPFSSVMKRIDDNSYDFIYKIYHTVKDRLASGEFKQHNPG